MRGNETVNMPWGSPGPRATDCSAREAAAMNSAIAELFEWGESFSEKTRVETIYALFCGVSGAILNGVLAVAVKFLLSKKRLPWRRYKFVLSGSFMDVMACIFLVFKASFMLYPETSAGTGGEANNGTTSNATTQYVDNTAQIARKVFELLFEALALLLALNVSLTCLFQIIALRCPFFYRIALTGRRVKTIILSMWITAFVFSAVNLATMFDMSPTAHLEMENLVTLTILCFWIFTVILCLASCCVVFYMIGKMEYNVRVVLNKFILARGITISVIGIMFAVQVFVLCANFTSMWTRSKYYYSELLTCAKLRAYIQSWSDCRTGYNLSLINRLLFMTRIVADPFHYLFGTAHIRMLLCFWVCGKKAAATNRTLLEHEHPNHEVTLATLNGPASSYERSKGIIPDMKTCPL